MPRTKKAGPTGGLGPRYGTKVRMLALEVERKLRQAYRCPSCGAESVKRVSTSIWRCRRCGMKFAGGTYSLSALAPAGKMQTREEE